jgi:hypothetical protein
VITCGGDATPAVVDPTHPYPRVARPKYVVPILPLPLDERESEVGETQRSTGCGARIHASVVPCGIRTWGGRADAAGNTVVPLSAIYFTPMQGVPP